MTWCQWLKCLTANPLDVITSTMNIINMSGSATFYYRLIEEIEHWNRTMWYVNDVFTISIARIKYRMLYDLIKKSMFTYIVEHYKPWIGITIELLTPPMLKVLILYTSCGIYILKSTLNDRFVWSNSFYFTLTVFFIFRCIRDV